MKITPYQRQRAHDILDLVINGAPFEATPMSDTDLPNVFIRSWESTTIAPYTGTVDLTVKMTFSGIDRREKERRKG